jgi:predicted transcriptional regulator
MAGMLNRDINAVARLCDNDTNKNPILELAMSTTTIRLPEDLKARVAAAAKRAGTTSHSFILDAIAEKADQEERRGDFNDVAEKRYVNIIASGKTIPWSEMRSYLEHRVAGKALTRPVPRKLAR